jgi:2-iminobutanoate/2-iminopropanoate deaminase
MRTTFSTEHAPQPAGPYAQCARVGNIVQSAGQVGLRPDGTRLEGIGPQTSQALSNVLEALAAAGASESDIVSVRVYLTHPDHFTEMNAAYGQVLSEPYPCRTTVYVGLRPGLLVEIDALAVLAE